MIDETLVRETFGVTAKDGLTTVVLARECSDSVFIEITGGRTALLGPNSAHRLAERLHRLARRIENRKDANVP